MSSYVEVTRRGIGGRSKDSIVGTGTTLIAFLLAGILWTGTVAVAWVFYRPLVGIAILLVTLALIVMVAKRFHKPAPALSTGPPPFDGPPPLS